ncbi:MAG: XdhC family protein [Deltaproteobacteria bacterium]|nr:XdhC family protein [Deltaproteobacteria bacterium]
MFDEFFSKALELRRQGRPFATATVVRAEKPTSAKPGDKAIITLDGVMYGWIGGSCAQPAVVREALEAIAADVGQLIRLSPEPADAGPRDGIKEVPMTCFSGGTLDIYIEPQQPQARLLIVGNLPLAQALAHLGKAMSFHVVAIDPEGTIDSKESSAAMAHADQRLTDLGELAKWVHPLTYVVIATHGHFDEEAASRALSTAAPYVGLVASPKRGEAIRSYLALEGFEEAQRARLKVPAGLDIGAVRGDEIALSILAEIIERRRALESVDWSGEEPSEEDRDTQTAIDPVCHMKVEIATALHTHQLGEDSYYFCCLGCRERFAAEPDTYLSSRRSSS